MHTPIIITVGKRRSGPSLGPAHKERSTVHHNEDRFIIFSRLPTEIPKEPNLFPPSILATVSDLFQKMPVHAQKGCLINLLKKH
jgi:hypothetical protein